MSDDTPSGERPNSKYKLSNPDSSIKEDELVFYYNRERRLENAPEAVKNFYNESDKKQTFSLLGPLLADRPRRILFAIIVLMCIAILGMSYFGYFDTSYLLEENKIEIKATIFEDTTIVVLKKNTKKSNAYSGAVDIAVSVPVSLQDEEPVLYTHRIFFSLENEEVYRFAVPFTAPELLMVLQSEKANLNIKFKPD